MPKAAAILTLQEWALQNGHSGTGYANTDPCRHTNRIWFQSLTLLLPMNAENHQTHKLIIEDSKGQEEYTLEEPIYSIGRDPSCDIRLSSFFVSRHHATLVRSTDEAGGYCYRIVDGNLKGKVSANGLLINGRRAQSHDLKNQDKIIFGPQVQAIYYRMEREKMTTVPPDEFDEVTLISPNSLTEEDTADSMG